MADKDLFKEIFDEISRIKNNIYDILRRLSSAIRSCELRSNCGSNRRTFNYQCPSYTDICGRMWTKRRVDRLSVVINRRNLAYQRRNFR